VGIYVGIVIGVEVSVSVRVKVNIAVGVIIGVCVFVDVGIKVGPNNCSGPQEDINNIAIIIVEATFIFIAPPMLSQANPTFSNWSVCVGKSAQRLAAQLRLRRAGPGALGCARISIYYFSRNSKTAIQRSLAEPWPSRLKPSVGRDNFVFSFIVLFYGFLDKLLYGLERSFFSTIVIVAEEFIVHSMLSREMVVGIYG
jgi:hypothetical protein